MTYLAKTNIINAILSSIRYIFFYKFIINKSHQNMKKIILSIRVNHGTIALWETGRRSVPGPVTLIIDNFKTILLLKDTKEEIDAS